MSTFPLPPGFPPESYKLKYPAPGSPELADKVAGLLKAAGMECRKDAKRGFDHGALLLPPAARQRPAQECMHALL